MLTKQCQTCHWERDLNQNQQTPMDEFVQIGVMDAATGLGGKSFLGGATRQHHTYPKGCK